MLKSLNRETADIQSTYPERIVQFGGGNFLRAFVDWMVEIMNQKTDFGGSVVIVKPTAGSSYTEMAAQDGLFYVRLHGYQDGAVVTEQTLVTCVSRAIHPYEAFDDYLALAEQPEIRVVVSNTTEAGIVFRPEDRPDDRPPQSFPAKLAVFLHHRYQHFDGDPTKGCVVLPCELIEENGTRLKAIIQQLAEQWQLETGFVDWLNNANVFCNTLVDRIVTGFPEGQEQQAFEAVGYEDRLLVEGEQYHSWVIEGPESVRAVFPVTETGLNVKLVDDLTPYRTVKVRILNGAHTAMVPVGYFMDLETVRDVVEDADCGPFIRDLLFDEIIPDLESNLSQAEVLAFAEDVLVRFRNSFLRHQLLSIALNSLSKFKARLLPSLLAYHDQSEAVPLRLSLALAAMLRFYKGTWQGQAIPLQDDPDWIIWLQGVWQRDEPLEVRVRVMLENEALWDMNMAAIPGLVAAVAEYLTALEKDSMRVVVKKLNQMKVENQ